MGKARKAGPVRQAPPPDWTLGLVNPFKVTEDHKSAHNLAACPQLSLYTPKEPAHDEQSSHSATNAPRASLRSADDTLTHSYSTRAFGDHTRSYNAASHDLRVNDDTEPVFHKKLSDHAVEQPTIPMAIQDDAFHSQFETVRRTTTGSSLYNTMAVTEYLNLNHNHGSPLAPEGMENQVESCLALDSPVSNPGCVLSNCLFHFQPSADVLDFLELRRNFNTWVQIARLRNEGRHPTLKHYIAAVLEEFENGYKDLEDKLAEKLFPLSGVQYEKARG
ncbi:hypothetical protein MMC32_004516 [Xylographa parallela]|nr:hypothetical protein [Xylographa parallela]